MSSIVDLERLVSVAVRSGQRQLLTAARVQLLVARSARRERGEPTAQLDQLLETLREAREEFTRSSSM
jgi:hypothetical protein